MDAGTRSPERGGRRGIALWLTTIAVGGAALWGCGSADGEAVTPPPSTTGATAIVPSVTSASMPPTTPSRPATSSAPASTGPETTVPPESTVPPPPYTAVAHRPADLDALAPTTVVTPVGLRISALGVDAPVVAVGTDRDGVELAVPPAAGLVAWYQFGPTPGAAGSAVLAAHVAYDGAAGAFLRLADLSIGDTATVTMSDGRELVFQVTEVAQVPKPELPRDRVFARDGVSGLVLVTCGGQFETATRHYKDNIVAYLEAAF